MSPCRFSTAASLAAAAAIAGSALAADQVQIPLNYNFNGLMHPGEAGWPDNPDGFRSISDRALIADGNTGSFNFGGAVGSTGLSYFIVASSITLDIVHLGNRLVSNAYDATEDGDNIGIQPNWDITPDHTVPQVSDVSGLGIEMFGNTQIGVLYQASNSGGQFDMTLSFSDATSVTVRLSAPDWFGANNPAAPLAGVLSQSRFGGAIWNATNSNDLGATAPAGERLNLVEAIISTQDLINDGFGSVIGKTLSSITFGNATYPANFGRGYAIIAATARGAENFGPVGSGAVNPNPVVFGNTAKFSVTPTLGSGVPNHITSVTVDASALNLGVVALNDSGANGDISGDGIWTSDVSVPTDIFGGPVSSQFTITDAQARQFMGVINYSAVAPPNAIDIGTLADGFTTYSGQLDSGGVHWIKFTLPHDVDRSALQFFDIDTENSSVSGGQFANDTQIGLYTLAGNRVVFDDDDGTDFLSQISIGATLARSGPGNGLAYNGRDGALIVAGTYFLAYTGWPATFNATLWSITAATHTSTGTVAINFNIGTIPGGGLPAVFTDLGVLTETPVSSTQALSSGGVQWFRFQLASSIDGSAVVRQFLDIDTEGSGIADTLIALFRDDGAGTLVATDNDDGSGLWSQFSYGRGTRPAPGDGVAYNGRDAATLAAGVYYIALTESLASFGNNYVVAFNTGVSTGPVTLNLRRGVQSAAIAGPIHNPANNSDYYLLDRGFTFTQAEAFAVGLGGHLASIQDADENEFVRGSVLGFGGTDRRGWIGFNDEASEGNFVWTDGSAVVFTNWSGGEPNNAGGTEHYAEMLGSNGLWNDLGINGVSGGGDWAVVEVPGGGPMFCDADWCQDGVVGVPDIFCFLTDWFALDPDARNYGGSPGVPAIFAFLSAWFAAGIGPCTP